jgi:hypothetical protein
LSFASGPHRNRARAFDRMSVNPTAPFLTGFLLPDCSPFPHNF